MSISQSTLRLFFVAAALRMVLELSFVQFTGTIFAYQGFTINASYIKYIESWLLYSGLVAIFPRVLKRPSDYLLTILLYNLILPVLIYYALTDASGYYLYLVILCTIIICSVRRLRFTLDLKYVRSGSSILFPAAILISLLGTCAFIFHVGVSTLNVNFLQVSVARERLSEHVSTSMLGYIIPLITKVCLPVLLGLSLWREKYRFAIVVVLVQLFWFALTSHKGMILYPLYIVFLWKYFRDSQSLLPYPALLLSVVSLSLSAFFLFKETWLSALLIHRTFFKPAQLTFAYYEYFDNGKFIYWTNSKLSALLGSGEYPYSIIPERLIGEYIGGGGHANNSFISAGFMHAGIAGVIIYGIIVGLLFLAVDITANKALPIWLSVSFVLIPFQTFIISTDLPAAIYTHGVLLSLVLLFLSRTKSLRDK